MGWRNPNGRYLSGVEVKVAASRRGLTIQEALEFAEIPRQTYRYCVYGATTIDMSRIEKLAAVLRVLPEAIIANERPSWPKIRRNRDASQT
jgi:hypothetical protein